jgi:hypothetical protein
MGKKDGDELTDEEIARRRDEALLRALSTPHKPHSAMKLGRRTAKREPSKPSPRRASQEKADKPSNGK